MQNRPSVKRWNPVLGEWVIIAPATSVRPWSGSVVSTARHELPDRDPSCYLCPGVTRAGGMTNPDYRDVYVFDNDFPSLSMTYADTGAGYGDGDLPAGGVCRVVCFSPHHNVTLAEMSTGEVETVLRTFRDQCRELSSMPGIAHVMPFENKGTVIGVSNPHPHGQIYATDFVPRIPMIQYRNASDHLRDTGSCLFCDLLERERSDGGRIVAENGHFTAFVPWHARHTFETNIMARRHVPDMTGLDEDELSSLADIYRGMLIRYDNLFDMPFPNITIFRNAPCDGSLDPGPCHFHIEFCPPLRSRDKLKYMAGFETGGGNVINPSLPAESAALLRSAGTVHYSERNA